MTPKPLSLDPPRRGGSKLNQMWGETEFRPAGNQKYSGSKITFENCWKSESNFDILKIIKYY